MNTEKTVLATGFLNVVSQMTRRGVVSREDAKVIAKTLLQGLDSPRIFSVENQNYFLIMGEQFNLLLSKNYNFTYDKETGYFRRWGEKYEDDPSYSPIGGEILDIEITTICKGINGKLCPFCSPKGTKINTPDGTQNIEKIRPGDFVLGFDIKNDHITIQKVEETYKRHYVGDLICIETDEEVLKLTPEHIVILKGGVEKQAQDVNEKDEIISF